MTKQLLRKLTFTLLGLIISLHFAYSQLPTNCLVGYHENWNTLKISQAHANYNVICLAFALPVNAPSVGYDLRYALPPGYASVAAMQTDIDLVHSQGKKVLLSIGGATGPILITSAAQQTTFINSINAIFTTYGNKIDGLDLDLETSSMNFGAAWTMTSPTAYHTYLINAVKSIMATYQTTNGKKMILTMAPEAVYLMGGLSTWQVTNANGGIFLPIIDGLRTELDLLHMQLYNAGGASGGVIAWNGTTYFDTGSADFALAMNESIVKGFTCVSGKGTFVGIPDSKVAFGLPATSSSSTAGTGYVTPANICAAAKYFKGVTGKPAGVTYTMNASRPGLKGLMTWSINQDQTSVNGAWNFAINYTCAFPAGSLPVELSSFSVSNESNNALLNWATDQEINNAYFEILRSTDGVEFTSVGMVKGVGNSSYPMNYSFLDASVNSGTTYYYKLKQVDYNGQSMLSYVVSVNFDNLSKVDAIPSAVSSGEQIKLVNHSAEEISNIVLTDLAGKVYAEYHSSVNIISTTGLPTGIYLLRILMGEELVVKKVMVY